MKKLYFLFTTFLIIFVLISSSGMSQDKKHIKNFTPVTTDNNKIKTIHNGQNDNILTFLIQDFEGTVFPPAGWTNSGTAMWTRSTDASGYGVGTASALADFYSISTGGQLNLISPVFTPSVASDSLKFDHAYATYQTEVDQLQVYTSTNGGTTWTLLITLLGGVSGPLVTAPPTTNIFVPTSSQWATKKYALPVGTNSVKFTGVSAYGNELYLDNIVIGTPFTNDVGLAGIDAPSTNIAPGTVAPKVTVKNWGLATQTFPVTVTISPGGYTATQTITSLAPGASQQITLTDWTPGIGSYNVTAVTQLGTDQNKSNDTSKLFVIVSNVNRGVLLEYCTGTWCQWCPCGATTAHALETTYPNLVVLAYHGASTDPWQTFNGNGILSAMGLNAYPTGIFDRQNAAGDYTTWTAYAANRYNNFAPTPITINITSKNYNAATGLLSVTADITSNCDLPLAYSVNYVIMENNLVYSQTGNTTCTGNPAFVHNHVVRNMVNNQNGDILNTGAWTAGTTITKTFSTTISTAWVAENCEVVIFVYKGTTANNMAEVQNVIKADVTSTGIIGNTSVVPVKYELSQNYPNPFNPETNIHFAIPKEGFVSLKIYDITGKEIMSGVNDYLKAGYYNVSFNASSLSSGVYFYKLMSKDFTETKKMMLVK